MAAPAFTIDNNPSPATQVAVITDGAEASFTVLPRALYIGTAGDVAAYFPDAPSSAIVFKNLLAGTILPIRPTKVGAAAAGTSCTKLIALF